MSYISISRAAHPNAVIREARISAPLASTAPPSSGPIITTEAVVLGRIKWFSAEKGFGFVAFEDGTDVFLHGSVSPVPVSASIKVTQFVSVSDRA